MTKLKRTALTRGWLIVIVSAACVVLLVKLYLALTSEGSADVIGFADHLAKIRELGGIRTYGVKGPFNNPFNSPPFMIHVLRVLGLLSDATRLPFKFWLRLPSILADVGSLFLVWRLLGLSRALPRSPLLLLLLILCPVSVMVSGFHGSTDPLMIFFVLLSIYLIEKQERRRWLAGIAFGLALNIKVAPLILAPALCFYLTGMKSRVEYFGAAAATFIVGSLPYVLLDASILKNVFGYSSLYGQWGWSALLERFYWEAPRYLNPPHDVIGIHAVFAAIGKWSMLLGIAAVSFWMNRRAGRKPPLILQCGLIFTLFLFLTPGFGIQYLSWLVPLVVALDVWPTLLFYLTAGLYQLMGYTCWAERAAPPHMCLERNTTLCVMLQCWGALLVLSLIYLYRISAWPHATAERAEPVPLKR
jgi:hypothetical protein